MERLTDKSWRNLDPWECCGQDKYCKRGCHDEGGCNNGCIVPKLYSRLARYEDAEEQGQLIVLPNAEIWETLFYVINGEIYEGALYRVAYENYHGKIHTDVSAAKGYNSFGSRFEDFGKTVFLSREEAEKALEGMK